MLKKETRTVTYENEPGGVDDDLGMLVSAQSHATRTQTIETTTVRQCSRSWPGWGALPLGYRVGELTMAAWASFLSICNHPSCLSCYDNFKPCRQLFGCTVLKFAQHDPDSKVHGANMGPTWVLSAPDGPHVGPMNLAIRGIARQDGTVCKITYWVSIVSFVFVMVFFRQKLDICMS